MGSSCNPSTVRWSPRQHGVNAVGRWVGLSYDGPITTACGALAKSKDEVVALMDKLKADEKVSAS